MTNALNFEAMEVELLAEECSNETKKYFRGVAYEARYCFELMCRANRDLNEVALSHIYVIYLPMLASRARRHPMFYQSCQDAESFARTALANFHYAVKGEKFLQKFSTLAQAIAYMNTCIHTAVLEDVQDNPTSTAPESEELPSPAAPSAVELQELWAYICSLLPDPDEQRLAYCRFVLEMKPAEIVEYYPQLWATARDVSVALQNIRRRLRGDSGLRGLVGLPDDATD